MNKTNRCLIKNVLIFFDILEFVNKKDIFLSLNFKLMKMKSMHLFVFLCSLLSLQSISYGQAEKQLCGTYQKENLRNIAKEDADLIDQFGNYYTFNELVAPQLAQQVRSGGGVCQCGVFQLTFTGFTTAEEETICAVFDYVSGIITTGAGGDQPIINVVKKPMGGSTLGLGTTFFTPDCGIANNFIFDVMNSGAAATQPLGTASGVLCINSLFPMYTMNETPAAGEFDLYTVALHEVLHILGFSSQIGPNGDTNQGFYSMWDAFLFSGDDNEFLITPGATPPPGCCDFSEFNPNLDFNDLITSDCDMNIFFNNTQIAEVYGEGAGDIGNLLSHLHRCGSGGDQYVMHAGLAALEERRIITPEEIEILLTMGYTPIGATDEPCRVIAVDDFFQIPIDNSGMVIDLDQITANDNFVDDDGEITIDEIEIHTEGCGSELIAGAAPRVYTSNNSAFGDILVVEGMYNCSTVDICYTIRGCDNDGDGIPDLCDDGLITVTRPCLPCLPPLAPCPPPNCGENLVCNGDFNSLTPQAHVGISQSSGYNPCGFERTPDVVYLSNTNNAVFIRPSESIAIPLLSPIQPGCTASISLIAGGLNGSATISIAASADAPCVEDGDFICPPAIGANYICMGNATVGNGFSDPWIMEDCGPQYPMIDCSCIEEFPLIEGNVTWMPASITNIVNDSDFPLDFIYISTNRRVLLDDVSVTSECDNDLSVTVEQIEEVCIGQETAFEVEICYTGANQTPVDIELTANLPMILGLSIPANSPFEGGSLVLPGVVPSPTCINTTFNLFVDFSIAEGTELPISFDVMSPNACLSPLSEIAVNPTAIECEIPCELAAYPTVTPVCGNELGCINFVVAGGSGDYFYMLNGGTQTDPEFCGLAAGTYTFAIVDQNDDECRTEIEVEVEVDPDCSSGCDGDVIMVNYEVDDEYCLSSDGTSTQYYLDLHIPNWSGTQSTGFKICSEDVTIEGATVISMVVENKGYALDIYTIIEVDNSISSPSEICFSVPVCVDGEEFCARFCLEELPECKEGCPFDILPEITLMELDASETCAGFPGSNYLAVSGSVQLSGITWQNVTVEYNQLNGAPVPGGYFKFKNLPNSGGIVNTPIFEFCWNNTFGLEYFCFEVIITDEASHQECVETFCIPVTQIVMKNSPKKGKEFSPPSKPLSTIDWYPNPTKDILNVYNRSEQRVIATISNLQGQYMISEGIEAHEIIQISSVQWPAGLYVLDVRDRQSGQLISKEKIVVIH